MADEVKEDLKRHGLLGSTSVSVDGAPVLGLPLPLPLTLTLSLNL
jgi:hypothetical protein